MKDHLRTDFPTLPFRFHEWISYEDRGRPHGAEPDGFIVFPAEVIALEFKLTGSLYGKAQLLDLYAPLLGAIFSRPVRCLQIAKNLTPETPGPFLDLPSFLATHVPYATWQWIR